MSKSSEIPTLPPNIWVGPIPKPDDPEFQAYMELAQTWNWDDDPQAFEPVLQKLDGCVPAAVQPAYPDYPINYECNKTGDVEAGTSISIACISGSETGTPEDCGSWNADIVPCDQNQTSPAEGMFPVLGWTQWGTGQAIILRDPHLQLPPSMDLETNDVRMLQGSGGYLPNYVVSSWFVFKSCSIPQGATINKAYVQFTWGHEVGPGGAPYLAFISGWFDPSLPTSAEDAETRSRTNNRVEYRLETEPTGTFNTVDISCVVEELVGREDYQQGNDLCIVFDGYFTHEGSYWSHFGAMAVNTPPPGGDAIEAEYPTLFLWYDAPPEEMNGGVICDGAADVYGTNEMTMRGGVLIGGGGTGGVLVDGTATSVKTSTIRVSGGVRINGSVFTYNETMSGGILLDGEIETGTHVTNLTMLGGCKVGGLGDVEFRLDARLLGGAADVTAIYDVTMSPGEWSVIARGVHCVPPNPTTASALCWFMLDPGRTTMYYRITHPSPDGLDEAAFHAPATEWQNTPNKILLGGSPWLSPITGHAAITLGEGDVWLQNGLAYIEFTKGTAAGRAQIVRTAAKLTGHASETHDIEMSGGLLAAGGANQYSSSNEIVGGGLVVDGEGRTRVYYNPRPFWNGVRLSGLTDRSVQHDYDMIGGVKVDGGMTFLYTSNETMNGGVLLDATNVYSFEVPVGLGTLIIAGNVPAEWWAWPLTSGGVVVDGQHEQTFIDYVDGLAGLRAGGAARIGFTRYHYSSAKKGYCRAMASENICTIPAEVPGLIPPTSDISPALSDNRFQVLEGSGWRDPTDANDYAMLPPIVKSRQNTYLPPKSPTRRKATSLTQYAVVTNSS